MTTKEKMKSDRKTAMVVGVLFIIATVAGVLSVALLGPILNDPDYLSNLSANEYQVIMGALIDLIGAGAFVALAVVIFPVLKRYSERIGIGYIVARGLEAVPFIIANISLLALLTVSQEYVKQALQMLPLFYL